MKEHKRVWSWEEFVTQADEGLAKGDGFDQRARDFNHHTSFKAARTMAAETGYMDVIPETERLVSHVDDTIAADLFATTFTSTWEVAGGSVDVGRFLAGDPECMLESQPIRIARRGRAVRIAVPVNYSASVPAEYILRRGAAIMALVDILARAQHPVEIWGAICNSRRDDRTCILVKVQAANEPLDMGRVMFALAHPAMLRQLGFAAEQTFPDAVRRTMGYVRGGGYGGYPFDVRETDFDETDGTTIVLPPIATGHADTWTEAQALEWIKEQIALIFD